MFRQYDTECTKCGHVHVDLIDVPNGGTPLDYNLGFCGECSATTSHKRLISLPSPYMGELVANPQYVGGRYDTMGKERLPALPDLPGSDEYSHKVNQRMGNLPADISMKDYRQAHADATSDAPVIADYASMFKTPEYKHAEAQRQRVKDRNKAKKKRATALLAGETVNMRRDRLPGDPSFT